MKKLYTIFLSKTSALFIFAFLLISSVAYSQSPCDMASPICSDSSYVFPNQTSGTAITGPDYGCLGSQPCPVWYYIRIAQGGILQFNLSQETTSGTGLDIDFAMWGPFTTLPGGCAQIMSGNLAPLQCSFSASSTETIGIGAQGGYGSGGLTTPPAAIPGQYYILILTNYSQQPGNVSLYQSNTADPGAGLTDCSIINPCDYTVSVDPEINVCAGDSVDISNAFDAVNSDPSINSYYTSFTDAIDSVNQMTSTIVGAGTYYIRSNYVDTLHCFQVNVINVTPGIDNANFLLTDYCEGTANQASSIATPGGVFAFNPVPTDGATIDPATGSITGGVGGTTYFVEYTTNQGCPNSQIDSVTVRVIPQTTVSADTTVCEGDSVTITASNPDNAVLSWSNGITNGVSFATSLNNPAVTDTNLYVVTLSKDGCQTKDTVQVIVHPNPPQANFAAVNPEACIGTPVVFVNYTGEDSTQTLTATWEFGDGSTSSDYDTASYAYSQNGTYDIGLTITNEYGCSTKKVAAQYVHIVNGPSAAFTANPTETDLTNTVVVFTNNSSGATNYYWNFGDMSPASTEENPTHTFPTDHPGLYTVVLYAYNANNCVDSSYLHINIIQPDPSYEIPNVFTPDGDGVNDFFKFVHHANIKSFHVEVLNRWGNLVFESDKTDFKWNGEKLDSGKMCDDGTYFYKMNIKAYSGKEKTEFGYVHLIMNK